MLTDFPHQNLMKGALTDKTINREMFMKGLPYSR